MKSSFVVLCLGHGGHTVAAKAWMPTSMSIHLQKIYRATQCCPQKCTPIIRVDPCTHPNNLINVLFLLPRPFGVPHCSTTLGGPVPMIRAAAASLHHSRTRTPASASKQSRIEAKFGGGAHRR
eukprot:364789-Chlamydomonas_euryale.AAC.4